MSPLGTGRGGASRAARCTAGCVRPARTRRPAQLRTANGQASRSFPGRQQPHAAPCPRLRRIDLTLPVTQPPAFSYGESGKFDRFDNLPPRPGPCALLPPRGPNRPVAAGRRSTQPQLQRKTSGVRRTLLGQLAFDRAGQSIILPPAPKPFRLIQTIQLGRNFTQQTESIFCDDPAVVRFVGRCLQSGDYSQGRRFSPDLRVPDSEVVSV